MNNVLGFFGDIAVRLTHWLDLDFWELLLLFMLLMLYRLLAKAHTATNNTFDVQYFLVDDITDRVSLKKLGALLALLISSWIVLFMTVKGLMTESILGLYLLCWAGVYMTPQTIAAWKGTNPIDGAPNGQPKT